MVMAACKASRITASVTATDSWRCFTKRGGLQSLHFDFSTSQAWGCLSATFLEPSARNTHCFNMFTWVEYDLTPINLVITLITLLLLQFTFARI